jgi:hypothetical protein
MAVGRRWSVVGGIGAVGGVRLGRCGLIEVGASCCCSGPPTYNRAAMSDVVFDVDEVFNQDYLYFCGPGLEGLGDSDAELRRSAGGW